MPRLVHVAAASVAVLAILAVAAFAIPRAIPSATKWTAWTAAAVALVESAPLGDPSGFVHALLAQFLLGLVALTALFTSDAWSGGPETVQDYGWPSLRSLAVLTPLAVAVQVTLGAAFRHDRMTLLPHILGALIVSMIILITCAFVLHQFPKHRELCAAAKGFMGIAFAQVFVGMFAYSMRAVPSASAMVTSVVGITHVTIGAATLAASLILSAGIRRNVRPAAETSSSQAETTA